MCHCMLLGYYYTLVEIIAPATIAPATIPPATIPPAAPFDILPLTLQRRYRTKYVMPIQ
jgi:hypothetical protein